jgi:hypothetical protein
MLLMRYCQTDSWTRTLSPVNSMIDCTYVAQKRLVSITSFQHVNFARLHSAQTNLLSMTCIVVSCIYKSWYKTHTRTTHKHNAYSVHIYSSRPYSMEIIRVTLVVQLIFRCHQRHSKLLLLQQVRVLIILHNSENNNNKYVPVTD